MTSEKPKSLMRNLGEFFGHIAHGVKSNPDDAQRGEQREVRREVEEREETGPDGRRVTLRRTTIEEVEIQPGDAPNKNTAEQPDGGARRE